MGGGQLSAVMARLYLDVDGVLNPYVAPGEVPATWPDFREDFLGRRLVVWSPAMLTAIGQLPVELVWVTTWESAAEQDFGPELGSRRSRRVLSLAATGLGIFGPKPAVIAEDLQANPAPFVWVDDEVITPAAIDQLAAFGQPMLTISPNRRIGIEPNHIRQVEAFLRSLAQTEQGP